MDPFITQNFPWVKDKLSLEDIPAGLFSKDVLMVGMHEGGRPYILDPGLRILDCKKMNVQHQTWNEKNEYARPLT